ncbi:MAG: phage tail protein [Xanthomonadales bacterium]|nr:phage tail protein [Xanthomonadales bacterium]
MADPVPGFRFLVTLDNADAYLPSAQAALLPEIAPGEFKEAKGLGADLEVMGYPEGGVNDFVHQLPVRHSWNRIVLNRGVVKDLVLWQWYQAGLTQSLGARRDGSVILLNEAGESLMAWDFKGGIAAKWTGPELNAMENAIAIETLEIAHQGLNLNVMGGTLDVGAVVDAVVGFFD